MEHRWSLRKPVCLDALVLHRLSGLMPATVRDISLEGVFITVEYPALPSLALVELSFALAADDKRAIQQTEAFVIHQTRNGYGLMFKNFRQSAFQVLKDVLYAA